MDYGKYVSHLVLIILFLYTVVLNTKYYIYYLHFIPYIYHGTCVGRLPGDFFTLDDEAFPTTPRRPKKT